MASAPDLDLAICPTCNLDISNPVKYNKYNKTAHMKATSSDSSSRSSSGRESPRLVMKLLQKKGFFIIFFFFGGGGVSVIKVPF